ncbi:unnamed protein product, partial [Ixodes pacificus]
ADQRQGQPAPHGLLRPDGAPAALAAPLRAHLQAALPQALCAAQRDAQHGRLRTGGARRTRSGEAAEPPGHAALRVCQKADGRPHPKAPGHSGSAASLDGRTAGARIALRCLRTVPPSHGWT